MNHTLANNLLFDSKFWCDDCFWGIDLIVFSNSKCTGHWGGYCNMASYEFKGSYSKIIIGNMNTLDYDDLLFLMKHELIHHEQYLANPFRSGFSLAEEEEAYTLAQEQYYKV